jgi:hypothetical protein
MKESFQGFTRSCCLHHQGDVNSSTLKKEAEDSSNMLFRTYKTTRRHYREHRKRKVRLACGTLQHLRLITYSDERPLLYKHATNQR